MKFEINETYVTNEGVNIICYDKTEDYSFLCPFEIIENENNKATLKKYIGKTTVYSNEDVEGNNPSPIKIIESYFEKDNE